MQIVGRTSVRNPSPHFTEVEPVFADNVGQKVPGVERVRVGRKKKAWSVGYLLTGNVEDSIMGCPWSAAAAMYALCFQ